MFLFFIFVEIYIMVYPFTSHSEVLRPYVVINKNAIFQILVCQHLRNKPVLRVNKDRHDSKSG